MSPVNLQLTLPGYRIVQVESNTWMRVYLEVLDRPRSCPYCEGSRSARRHRCCVGIQSLICPKCFPGGSGIWTRPSKMFTSFATGRPARNSGWPSSSNDVLALGSRKLTKLRDVPIRRRRPRYSISSAITVSTGSRSSAETSSASDCPPRIARTSRPLANKVARLTLGTGPFHASTPSDGQSNTCR